MNVNSSNYGLPASRYTWQVIRLAVTFMLLILGSGISSATFAADQKTDPQNCLACHDDKPMLGVHSGAEFGLTNLVAACTDCHGYIDDLKQHEDGLLDVISFALDTTAITIQNESCVSCHKPSALRIAHWTHDVHASGLSCASCHNLHANNDSVRGLSEKASIKLCVDCHSARTLAGEGE